MLYIAATLLKQTALCHLLYQPVRLQHIPCPQRLTASKGGARWKVFAAQCCLFGHWPLALLSILCSCPNSSCGDCQACYAVEAACCLMASFSSSFSAKVRAPTRPNACRLQESKSRSIRVKYRRKGRMLLPGQAQRRNQDRQ